MNRVGKPGSLLCVWHSRCSFCRSVPSTWLDDWHWDNRQGGGVPYFVTISVSLSLDSVSVSSPSCYGFLFGKGCFIGIRHWAGIAHYVERRATDWAVCGSHSGGGLRFSPPVQAGLAIHPASCTTVSCTLLTRLHIASNSTNVFGKNKNKLLVHMYVVKNTTIFLILRLL